MSNKPDVEMQPLASGPVSAPATTSYTNAGGGSDAMFHSNPQRQPLTAPVQHVHSSAQGPQPSTGSRLAGLGRTLKKSTANFFGIGDEDTFNSDKWEYRRVKMLNRKTGNVTDHRFKQQSLSAAPSVTASGDVVDFGRQQSTMSFRRQTRQAPASRLKKDSLISMAVGSMRRSKKHKKKDGPRSRTFAPSDITAADEGFDLSIGPTPVTAPATATPASLMRMPSMLTEDLEDEVFFDFSAPIPPAEPEKPPLVHIPEDDVIPAQPPVRAGWGKPRRPPQPLPSTPGVDTVDGGIGMKRILDNVMDKVQDNSDRRRFGMGFVGKLCGRKMKKDPLSRKAQKQLDDIEDESYRPYFTYWVTFVQIVIYIVSVSVYGIAPIGFEKSTIKAEVLQTSLAIEQVSYFEKDNLWIGPREADLIHLGAKYSPCMRRDLNVYNALNSDTVKENKTACCIRNDGSGCVQSSKAECSPTLSSWMKWTVQEPGQVDRVSGSVCGQDPKYCSKPMSVTPFKWKDDITKWPICENTRKASNSSRHMTCELLGHPCCTGIQGECMITTREHCTFIRGYFHEEAFLCSQVKCLKEICGMIPFANADYPDQFYRFWTSLFLSAGLFHLLVTILFQILVMRDLEKMAGPIRIGVIYMGSGVVGNLGSAIFLPYLVEAGPAGCQFGVLACLLVEYVSNWKRIERPCAGVGKLIGVIMVLFILGLLPWIDNYAHLFGFLFGLLLSFLVLPFVTIGSQDRRNRIITLVICSFSILALFAMLIVLFYVVPIYECKFCSYFNCIPFTATFCENMGVQIRRVKDDIK
ncbi:inactive rhomboid protein 1-like [Tubulanus polymorphus]|uniref:inactive rhomboid protein 1-like n=1 Tax=Tubulanus polymorphus TaxID=672921 RepID=UPI003DA2F694